MIGALRERLTRRGRALVRDVGYGLRWFFRAAPGWSLGVVVLQMLAALIPLGGLLVLRAFVDSLTAALGSSTANSDGLFSTPVVYALLLGVVLLAGVGVQAMIAYVSQVHRVRLGEGVRETIHDKALELELAAFESPRYHDELHLALRESLYRPASVAQHVTGLISGTASALAVGGLLAAFDLRILALLLGVGVPGLLLRLRQSAELFQRKREHAEGERRAWLLSFMITDLSFAKEVRAFRLGHLLKRLFRRTWVRLRSEELRLGRQRALAEAGNNGLAALVMIGALLLVAREVTRQSITIGTAVMYYGAFQRALSAAQGLRTAAAGLYEDSMFLDSLRNFLELSPKMRDPVSPVPIPPSLEGGMGLEDVTFTYPGSPRPALHGLTLHIEPGQVVGLAGTNGAGKSTVAKIFCRLYDPESGRALLAGRSLAEYALEELRRQITVVFQDQARFPFTVRENIALGDARGASESADVIWAAKAAGLHERIERLPEGYDTLLGKWFSSGQELSAGEWQKLALARALYRNTPMVILDEPSHSLDALAEAELFDSLKELVAGRTVLLISHHLASLRLADRIYVLDQGRIVEEGDHEKLMEQHGLYARMFRSQSSGYV